MKYKQTPLILNADSYKATQYFQYPDARKAETYIASRGGPFAELVHFGTQALIKKNLLNPISKSDVEDAKRILDVHLGPGVMNYDGWMNVVENHNGFLPLEIRSLPEGMVVPVGVAQTIFGNTDDFSLWAVGYMETMGLRDTWYGSTIATISWQVKKICMEFLKLTSDEEDTAIDFMVHDFGYRGVSSDESGLMGGMAHLINFMGTDTMGALVAAIELYRADVCGYSVIASEHSTMCANADAENRDDYASAEKMVSILEQRVQETGEFQIVSAVADTYDVYRFVRDYIGGTLKERIENSGGRFVVRPDSGDPLVVPIECIEILMDKFGYSLNSKGYKVLPNCIRVLQGDGVNLDSIREILTIMESKGIAADNIVFGMGGALLQHADRDTLKYAMKCSAIQLPDGTWKDIFKDPITDPGKTSLKGRITTVREQDGTIVTKRLDEVLDTDEDLMQVVYRNGKLLIDEDFAAIRERARSGLN